MATVGQAVHKLPEFCLGEVGAGRDLPGIMRSVDAVYEALDDMAKAPNIDWLDRRAGRRITIDEARELADGFARSLYRGAVVPIGEEKSTKHVELAFDVPIPDAPGWTFKGAIDHVRVRKDADGDKLWVDDWKTAQSRWTQARADASLQPTAYFWAYEQLTGRMPRGFTFHVVYRDRKGVVDYLSFDTLRSRQEVEEFGDRLRYAVKVIGLHDKSHPSDKRVDYEYHKYCSFREQCTPWEVSSADDLIITAE